MLDDFGMDMDGSAYWQEPDFLLTDMISVLVNKTGIQLGITLVVKGAVLTGTLVSEREYLAAMSSAFVTQAKKSMRSPSKEDLAAIEETFNLNRFTEDTYPEDLEDDDEDAVFITPPIRYLHLKDPTVLLPQPSIAFAHGEVSIMRIRMNTVDGWILGRAMVMPIDEDNFPPQLLH